jgi:rhamnogalacturonyl hydrolase YesR
VSGERIEKDRWQQALERQLEALQECQKREGVQSCLSCEKILGCEVRTRYVQAVYESMNKGQGGGFEF